MSELMKGLFRSPRFIERANGPHKVRSVPLRLLRPCWRAFLNSLQMILTESVSIRAPRFGQAQRVCQHPAGRLRKHYGGTRGFFSRQDPHRSCGRRLPGCRADPHPLHTHLTYIIHERFCCNHRSAATTRIRQAGSPLGLSTYCTSTHRVFTAPRIGLAPPPSPFPILLGREGWGTTNRHE